MVKSDKSEEIKALKKALSQEKRKNTTLEKKYSEEKLKNILLECESKKKAKELAMFAVIARAIELVVSFGFYFIRVF